MKKIRHIIEFIIVKIIFTILKRLPHTILFWISSTIGQIMFLLPPLRKLTVSNVKAAYPEKIDKETKKIARESLINLVQSMLEFTWFSGRPDRLHKHFAQPLAINELAETKTKDGNGFIYVIPHLGNWELAGLIFSNTCDHPIAAVARKLDNPYLNKLIIGNRATEGTRVIPAKGAVKGMMRSLAEGFIVVTLIDQNTRVRDGGIWTEFFGLPVPASRAPAMFARKRKCEIAIGGCIRVGKKYDTFTEELPKSISEYESDEEIINDLMLATERVIRKYPEQYLWMYKRFQHIRETATIEEQQKYPYYAEVVKPRFYSTKVPKEKNSFDTTQ